MTPVRIQRKRTKGWTMPANTVYVGRPTKWGNPFPVEGDWIVWTGVALGFNGDALSRRAAAVYLYRCWITHTKLEVMPEADDAPFGGAIGFDGGKEVSSREYVQGFAAHVSALTLMPKLPVRPSLETLRGKNLACFCPLDRPCHADVLLELANPPQPSVVVVAPLGPQIASSSLD